MPSTTKVWKGPEEEGVTQSLLSRFLACRERFRLYAVEGLTTADTFNHYLEFGNMWHECEETFASSGNPWERALQKCCVKLTKRYPLQQEQVMKWFNVIRIQFPIYINYWKKHPDVKQRTPLLQEETFCVPYELPSGRTVKLKGKWDSVDLVGKGKKTNIWLQENKTKSDIKEEQLVRQLSFDLQTMFYLVALKKYVQSRIDNVDVKGVRYNVIRRPLSGGRGSIRPHKATKSKPAETSAEFYSRLNDIIEKEPEYFFMRWSVIITDSDIFKFKQQFLNPILEELCNWWDHITKDHENIFSPVASGAHYRMPYGIYSPMAEGRVSEMDEYLASGSMLGLEKTNNLFPELN